MVSDVVQDGSYAVSVEFDEDTSRALDRESGWRYAQAVVTAAQRAEYDAAVLRQARQRMGKASAAAEIIGGLRSSREPLHGVEPLHLEPGVSAFTGEPFLAVSIGGESVGQWSVTDARSHAVHVLEALAVAELDTQYHQWLLTEVGVEPEVSRAVVGDLINWRAEGGKS